MAGYGIMGKWHSRALRDAGVELHTLVGRNPEAAAAFAEAHGYRCWMLSLDEALADPEVDAVILATRSEGHEAEAVRCLHAGKHTLIEIAIAVSLAGAERVVAAGRAQRQGLWAKPPHVVPPRARAADRPLACGRSGHPAALSGRQTRPGNGTVPGMTASPNPHRGFRFPQGNRLKRVTLFVGRWFRGSRYSIRLICGVF